MARPAGTTTGSASRANKKGAKCPDTVKESLADHIAQVLTGKKKLTPTPEHLDLEAKIKKAWAEGYRGFEKKEFKERDALFQRPLLKVEIGGYGPVTGGGDEDGKDEGGKGEIKRKYYGPGRVLIDRLSDLAAAEGYTVSVGSVGRVE